MLIWYSSVPSLRPLLYTANTVTLLCNILTDFPTSPETASAAVGVLRNAASHASSLAIVALPQVVDLVYSLLELGVTHPVLCNRCVGFLFNISNTIEHLPLLAKPTMAAALCSAANLQSLDATFAAWTCGLLCNVSSYPACRSFVNDAECVEMVSVLVGLNSDVLPLVRNVCGYFLNLGSAVVQTAACLGIVGSIVQTFPEDQLLTRWTFQYLYEFSMGASWELLACDPVVHHLCHGMAMGFSDLRFYSLGCGVLLNLSSTMKTAAVVAKDTVVELFLVLMAQFPDFARLQSHGVGFFSNLIRSPFAELVLNELHLSVMLEAMERIHLLTDPIKWGVSALFEVSENRKINSVLASPLLLEKMIAVIKVLHGECKQSEEMKASLFDIVELFTAILLNISAPPPNRAALKDDIVMNFVCLFYFFKKILIFN